MLLTVSECGRGCEYRISYCSVCSRCAPACLCHSGTTAVISIPSEVEWSDRHFHPHPQGLPREHGYVDSSFAALSALLPTCRLLDHQTCNNTTVNHKQPKSGKMVQSTKLGRDICTNLLPDTSRWYTRQQLQAPFGSSCGRRASVRTRAASGPSLLLANDRHIR